MINSFHNYLFRVLYVSGTVAACVRFSKKNLVSTLTCISKSCLQITVIKDGMFKLS